MPAQGDDPLGAEPARRQHRGEPDGAITDDGHHRPLSNARADRGVMPGGHHVGEGEQGLEDLIGMALARHGYQSAAGKRHADRFPLTAVDAPVAKDASAGQVIVEPLRQFGQDMSLKMNGAITRSPVLTAVTSPPTASTTPMNSWPIGPTSCGVIPR